MDLFGIRDHKSKLRSFKWFKSPKKSSTKSSNSLYLAYKEERNNYWLLQYLPPFSKTSNHYHKNIIEKHEVIAGECFIKNNKKSTDFLKKITKENEIHQLYTQEKGCILILEMIHQNKKGWEKDKIIFRNKK